jgi:small subunit ribosomal protein S1
VFVRLDNEIDGLVHISEIANERITDPGTILHMGEPFEFKIISIDPTQHRLGLSYKRLNEPEEKEAVAEDGKEKKVAKKKATTKKKLLDQIERSEDEELAA